MINQLFRDLEERWGYDRMVLDDIRDTLEDFGHSCYTQGYLDKCNEVKYYAGFSYSKKSDMDDSNYDWEFTD